MLAERAFYCYNLKFSMILQYKKHLCQALLPLHLPKALLVIPPSNQLFYLLVCGFIRMVIMQHMDDVLFPFIRRFISS